MPLPDYEWNAVERLREKAVRAIGCPVCDAQPRRKCNYPRVVRKDGRTGGEGGRHAHTGRYDLAAAQGLVPPLGGWHG